MSVGMIYEFTVANSQNTGTVLGRFLRGSPKVSGTRVPPAQLESGMVSLRVCCLSLSQFLPFDPGGKQ